VGSNDNLPAHRNGGGSFLESRRERKAIEDAVKRDRIELMGQFVKIRDAMLASIELDVGASLAFLEVLTRLKEIEDAIEDPVIRDQVRHFNNYIRHDGVDDLDKLKRIGKTNIANIAGSLIYTGEDREGKRVRAKYERTGPYVRV
jgi:hypothetical protein